MALLYYFSKIKVARQKNKCSDQLKKHQNYGLTVVLRNQNLSSTRKETKMALVGIRTCDLPIRNIPPQ